jgi:hypothetical protein
VRRLIDNDLPRAISLTRPYITATYPSLSSSISDDMIGSALRAFKSHIRSLTELPEAASFLFVTPDYTNADATQLRYCNCDCVCVVCVYFTVGCNRNKCWSKGTTSNIIKQISEKLATLSPSVI